MKVLFYYLAVNAKPPVGTPELIEPGKVQACMGEAIGETCPEVCAAIALVSLILRSQGINTITPNPGGWQQWLV